MIKTILKRLGLLVVTLLLVTILAFVAFSILPGDPTTSILGVDATAEQIAALRERLGLDLSLWQRYLNWLGGLFTGDLGGSYNYAMPVTQLLGGRGGVAATLQRGRARSLQLAALIDRGHRELPIRADYVGKNLPTSRDEFVKVMVAERDGEDQVVICVEKQDE